MENLLQRLLLTGATTALVLHFPELIAWGRLRNANTDSPQAIRTLFFLRKLLRIVFFFYIVLLAYTLYHPVPSRILVFPLPLLHLFALIIGERDLIRELPQRRTTDKLVRFIMIANIVEIGLLTTIALQIHGIVPA
jgi:hypothetical protein